jgi:hypothetical protein
MKLPVKLTLGAALLLGMLVLLAFAALTLLNPSFSRGLLSFAIGPYGVRATVENASSEPLSALYLSVTRDAFSLARLEPGERRSATLRP